MKKYNKEEVMRMLTDQSDDQRCIVEEFFRKEAEKPDYQRKNYCHISCPCSKCRPHRMIVRM